MTIGDVIIVKGITNKGKTRVNEHGEAWIILNRLPRVSCLNAPGVFLESIKTGHMCWTGIDPGIGNLDIHSVIAKSSSDVQV